MIFEIKKAAKNISYLVNESAISLSSTDYEDYFNREKILKDTSVEFRGGRGQTLLYKKDGLELVLRHYKRGGLIGKLIKDKFCLFENHCHRAFDEFYLLAELLKRNLPVPRPIIAKEQRFGLCLVQDIVVERFIGFDDLSYVIAKRALTDEEYESIGLCVKRFFDANVYHTDLNIRNILINNESKVSVIDFDKCFLLNNLSDKLKHSMIERLLRSFHKEISKNSVFFSEIGFEKLKIASLS